MKRFCTTLIAILILISQLSCFNVFADENNVDVNTENENVNSNIDTADNKTNENDVDDFLSNNEIIDESEDIVDCSNSERADEDSASINEVDIANSEENDLAFDNDETEAILQLTSNEEIIENGECGTTATYELYSNGDLFIYGIGEIYDYESIDGKIKGIVNNSNDVINVYIEEGITRIGKCAFYKYKSLKNVSFPSTLKSIGNVAFYESSISNPIFNQGLETIESNAFGRCSRINEIFLPNSLNSFSAFSGCNNLSKVTLEEGIKEITGSAFSGCKALKKITIPNSVKTIGSGAFANSGLTNIAIPESVETLESWTFSECPGICVYIPKTIKNIEECLFKCSDGASVYFGGKESDYVFNEYWNYIDTYFPYLEDSKEYVEKIYFEIPFDSFVYRSNVQHDSLAIEVPSNVSIILPYTFDCKETAYFYIPKTVDYIYKDSFYATNTSYSYRRDVTVLFEASEEEAVAKYGNNWRQYTTYDYATAIYGCTKDDFAFYASGKKMYNIEFEGNGETYGTTNSMMNLKSGYNYKLSKNNFIKQYYTFVGWNTKSDGTGISFLDEEEINSLYENGKNTTILYAQWEPTEYNVVYVLNGGENNKDNPITYKNGELFKLKNPSKNGYAFDGWYTDRYYTKEKNTIEISDGKNLLFFAKWHPVTYTITYYTNGGTNSKNNITKYTADTSFVLLNPKKNGYEFEGWFNKNGTNDNWGEKIETINSGTFGDIVLYAKWKPIDYSIIFSVNEDVDSGYENNEITYNIDTDTFTLLPAKWTNHVFTGWYEVKNDKVTSTKVTIIKKGTNRNYKLVAKFVSGVEYKVAFDGNGATKGKMSTITKKATKSLTLTKNSFSKNGYTFIGWSTEPNGEAVYDDKYIIDVNENWTEYNNSTITLYAVWAPTKYNIFYVNCDSINLDNVSTYTIEDNDISLYPVSKQGYTFNGWYLDKSFKKPVEDIAIPSGSYGNKTFYGKFTPYNYTIVFDSNGGTSGTMRSINANVGTTVTLTGSTFKKDGMVFDNWNTEPDGTGTTYTNKQKVKDLTIEENGIVTLYANYRHYIYNISFNANGGKGKMNKQQCFDNISSTLNQNTFTRVGYTFDGWNTVAKPTEKNPGIHYDDLGSITKDITKDNQSLTLYAQWKPITYTILFDDNTDNPKAINTVIESMSSIEYDKTYKLNKCTFQRNDGSASFVGWALTPNGPVKYKDLASVKNLTSEIDGVVTLYAKYKYTKTYKIKYVLNGGTSNKNITSYNVDTKYTFTAPTKKGYIFKGWYDNADFVGEEITNISMNTIGDKTLYAKWYSTSKDMADYVIANGNDDESCNGKFMSWDEAIDDSYYHYWLYTFDDDPTMLQFYMEVSEDNQFTYMYFNINTDTMKASDFNFGCGVSSTNYNEYGYSTLNASSYTKKTKLSMTIVNWDTNKKEIGAVKTTYSNYGNQLLQHMIASFDEILSGYCNDVCGEEVYVRMYDMGFFSYK